MEKRILLSVVVAGLLVLGITGTVLAGVEPSPFVSEINKLHSIELNISAIQKRIEKVETSTSLPTGIENYLSAMGNQLGVLDTRLADVLYLLPSFYQLGEDQEEVFYALYEIRTDAESIGNIFSEIVKRMGVEPTPFQVFLQSIKNQINSYIPIDDVIPVPN
jgi:hypothetical protein